MNSDIKPMPPEPDPTTTQPGRFEVKKSLLAFGILAAVLCALFFKPFFDWIAFSLKKERNSYLILVPIISGYLIWIKRQDIAFRLKRSSILGALFTFLGSVALLAAAKGGFVEPIDHLSLQMASLLCFLAAIAFILIGSTILRQITFPIAFLVFAIPMPTIFGDAIEIFLQYTSAEAAYAMLRLTPVPLFRDGLTFQLPGIAIRVAQECSGYNSTFALFLVSTLAGYLFLKSPWRRTVLGAAIIPLAILRNGFRILIIALLCVYVDPSMIDSFIHRHGGPIFFALSLIPFLMLLWWLRKSETVKSNKSMEPK